MVAKHADSKAKTVIRRPMDAVPEVFIAAMEKVKHNSRKRSRMRRGLMSGDIMAKPEMKRMPA